MQNFERIWIADGSTMEEAFHTVKRLLGLSYLWTGSINGVKLQVWEWGEIASLGHLLK
ncbi:MAG: hypothetical protein V7K21_30400 [Nostoc sp.]|uniref:hypothetical protein n=1 Tax=Nostoc sp. TaxID=1180 RepID=UPI002FF67A1A